MWRGPLPGATARAMTPGRPGWRRASGAPQPCAVCFLLGNETHGRNCGPQRATRRARKQAPHAERLWQSTSKAEASAPSAWRCQRCNGPITKEHPVRHRRASAHRADRNAIRYGKLARVILPRSPPASTEERVRGARTNSAKHCLLACQRHRKHYELDVALVSPTRRPGTPAQRECTQKRARAPERRTSSPRTASQPYAHPNGMPPVRRLVSQAFPMTLSVAMAMYAGRVCTPSHVLCWPQGSPGTASTPGTCRCAPRPETPGRALCSVWPHGYHRAALPPADSVVLGSCCRRPDVGVCLSPRRCLFSGPPQDGRSALRRKLQTVFPPSSPRPGTCENITQHGCSATNRARTTHIRD